MPKNPLVDMERFRQMNPKNSWRRVVSTTVMARKLHISDQTVRRWCEAKRIPARRFGPGQHWQIPLIIIEEIQLSYRG